MKARLHSLQTQYFGEHTSLAVQTFHLLGLAGMAAGVVVALSSLFSHAGAVNVAVNLAAAALAFVLLRYARKTGRYHRGCRIIVTAVFLVAFPVLFFTAGGYRSGMPCFFVFALVFTALMLPDKERAAALAAEFTLYAAVCLIAYLYPETVVPFAGERDYVTDVLTGIIVASVLLLLVILLYIRIYQRDQQRLKRLDNLRQEFLGNVSHELKTPLTSVSGYAQACQIILGMGIPDAANLERLKISADFMISESDRMIRLVEQLLDVTAAEQGGIRLQRAALSLAETAAYVRTFHFPALDKNHNTLTTDVPSGLPPADADRERVLQVFVNLLSNAMRHTRNGAIILSARQEGHTLRVALSDTGEGIPDDIKPALFERYLNAGVGRAAGMGIGLYICKQIVEAHGGEISLESEQGRGTTAVFTLPLWRG